jgi:hypothetical protein
VNDSRYSIGGQKKLAYALEGSSAPAIKTSHTSFRMR